MSVLIKISSNNSLYNSLTKALVNELFTGEIKIKDSIKIRGQSDRTEFLVEEDEFDLYEFVYWFNKIFEFAIIKKWVVMRLYDADDRFNIRKPISVDVAPLYIDSIESMDLDCENQLYFEF